MNRRTILTLALVAAALAATPSFAATYNLTACVTSRTIGASTIPMWGYKETGTADPCTSPGPVLTVPSGDTSLTINLTNSLPVATSIAIPGLTASFTPVRTADAQGRQRIRAFTTEAGAYTGSASYAFSGVKPGTYLYHSGSFPSLQVQMGLYGVVKQDYAVGTNNKEVILVYSEIDPDLPARQPAPDYTKTRGVAGYVPRYFLVNGEAAPPPTNGININDKVLIRLVNAGLKAHVPTLLGGYLSLIAEGGNAYPYPKNQYAANLPPLKTIDAIWVPTANGTYPLYDRSLDLTTNGTMGGGLQSKLVVGSTPGAPVAVNDNYSVAEDQVGGLVILAATGVLSNDTGTAPLTAVIVAGGSHGSVTLNSDGSFTYTPVANYNGPDLFTYKAVSGGVESNVATVNIAVTAVNDQPMAVADSATTPPGLAVSINVLANDSDIDGDPLTVTGTSLVVGGTTSIVSNQVVFTPACTGVECGSFTYTISDGNGGTASANVKVTVAVAPNQPPVAANDTTSVTRNTTLNTINVVFNDTDPDGSVNPATVVLTGQSGTPPTITTAQGGTVRNNLNGTVSYTPRRNFAGSDTFTYTVKDNLGAVSNTATVTVNVVR